MTLFICETYHMHSLSKLRPPSGKPPASSIGRGSGSFGQGAAARLWSHGADSVGVTSPNVRVSRAQAQDHRGGPQAKTTTSFRHVFSDVCKGLVRRAVGQEMNC